MSEEDTFETINRDRVTLIKRKFKFGLTPDEETELGALNQKLEELDELKYSDSLSRFGEIVEQAKELAGVITDLVEEVEHVIPKED